MGKSCLSPDYILISNTLLSIAPSNHGLYLPSSSVHFCSVFPKQNACSMKKRNVSLFSSLAQCLVHSHNLVRISGCMNVSHIILKQISLWSSANSNLILFYYLSMLYKVTFRKQAILYLLILNELILFIYCFYLCLFYCILPLFK